MLLRAITIEGLAAVGTIPQDALGVRAELPAGPVGSAVADGVALAQAALDASALSSILHRLRLAGPDTDWTLDEGLTDEVSALDTGGVDALVSGTTPRHVTIELALVPDPLLYRALREHATRDPSLVTALSGADTDLRLRIGWLFNRVGTHASVGALSVRVGEERLPSAPPDRPGWLPDMLRAIGARLGHIDPHEDEASLAERLLDASLSADPDVRAGWTRTRTALAEPPFSLGELGLVRRGPHVRLALGEALTPLRAWGPRGLAAVRLVATTLIDRPDVLCLDHPGDPAWVDWLQARTEGDDAVVEQLLVVGSPP